MNNNIIIKYTAFKQIFSKDRKMKISYVYGRIKDSKENWLDVVGDTQFYLMLDTGVLARVSEVTHA